MAFLISYTTGRKKVKPLEVKYNIARAFHYLGMNTHAQQIYEEVLKHDPSERSTAEKEELLTRARFNLSQILRGSGVSLGITVRGVNETSNTMKMGAQETKRVKYNAVWNAHKLLTSHVI